jgi:hypothetical protein
VVPGVGIEPSVSELTARRFAPAKLPRPLLGEPVARLTAVTPPLVAG